MKLASIMLIAGVLAGAILIKQHYTAKERDAEIATLNASREYTKVIQSLSGEYYALHQEAVNREPTVITERVLVKAKCPVRAPDDARMGNAGDTVRVELDERVVRDLAELADKHKAKYETCAVALRFHQETRAK